MSYKKTSYVYITSIDTFYVYRDSIIKIIDTLEVQKEKQKIIYIEKTSSIDSMSVDSNYVFFSDYLSRHFSYNN